MTDIEKINERITALQTAITHTQHAVGVDRKLGDRPSGHYTRALTELNAELVHLGSLLDRAKRQRV